MTEGHKSAPLAFLDHAQKDPELATRVFRAVARGGRVTAEEVLEIAKEFGYTFTRDEFESEVRRDIANRFAAGDKSVATILGSRNASEAPESACSRGCLSYTVSWHPPDEVQTILKEE